MTDSFQKVSVKMADKMKPFFIETHICHKCVIGGQVGNFVCQVGGQGVFLIKVVVCIMILMYVLVTMMQLFCFAIFLWDEHLQILHLY